MNFDEGKSQVDQVFDMAATYFTISDSEQVYDCTDSTKQELVEFFEQLSSSNL